MVAGEIGVGQYHAGQADAVLLHQDRRGKARFFGQQVARMLAALETADQREDRPFGPEGWEALPEGLSRRMERLLRLRTRHAAAHNLRKMHRDSVGRRAAAQ